MSIFSGLFKKKPQTVKLAPSFDGFSPIYPQFGTDIYRAVQVQQALKCIVDEMKKLNPTHVRISDSDPITVKGNIQDVLDEPNPLMTTSEFIEKTVWLLLLNYNAFIVPIYRTWKDEKTGAEIRYYDALYPICPSEVYFIEDASGKLFVNFWFLNGYQTTIPYEDVIHIRENYSVSEYMGGNRSGQMDREPLLDVLEIQHQLLQGLARAMKASYAINGIVKYNTLIDKEKMDNAIRDFYSRLRSSDSGVLPIDLKAEYIPITHDAKLVDATTIKEIDEMILRTWGVSRPILNGDFTPAQYNAFYQKALEGRIKSFSQALTKKMFTPRQKAFGNRIELYPKDLITLSPEQTLKMIEELSPTGTLFENEKRMFLGLKPLPELAGVRYMSLNWINANDASKYQVGRENVDVVDEVKEDV